MRKGIKRDRKAGVYSRDHHRKNWEKHIFKKYGLTVEDYAWMLYHQGFACGICHQPPKDPTKTLNVDHNHKTGFVRGLLCTFCNWKVLGLAERAGKARTLQVIVYMGWDK